MKRCRVIIPFTDKETGELRKMDDEIILSDERIAEIKSVNVNMIFVIEEVQEESIPEEVVPEEITEEEVIEEVVPEVVSEEVQEEEKPKKARKSK